MQQNKSTFSEIQNNEEFTFEPWKKYTVTEENRKKFPNLQEVSHVITAETNNGVTISCFVTKKQNLTKE